MVFVFRVPVPASPQDPQAWAVHEIVRLDEQSSLELAGHRDFCGSAQEYVVSMQPALAHESIHLLALAGPDSHEALGWASIGLPLQDNLREAEIQVVTDHRHRRQGIGRELYEAAVDIARQRGRTQIRSYTFFDHEPAAGEPALTSATSPGRIPADAPAAAFAQAMGYQLDQVDRASMLTLPYDAAHVAQLHAQAKAAAGDAFAVVGWVGSTPDEYLDAVAIMNRVLSTDAPQGTVGWEPEAWDAARVREVDARRAKRGMVSVSCAAVDLASGNMAGFTQLALPAAHPQAVFQENTVVLPAYRGHRLGMLIKAENLMQLAAADPARRRIHTWNAEENSYMLSINVALGFRRSGAEGQWLAAA